MAGSTTRPACCSQSGGSGRCSVTRLVAVPLVRGAATSMEGVTLRPCSRASTTSAPGMNPAIDGRSSTESSPSFSRKVEGRSVEDRLPRPIVATDLADVAAALERAQHAVGIDTADGGDLGP